MRDACFSTANPDRNEAIVGILYDTGIRAGECVELETEYFDADAGTLYLPSRIQKGNPPQATLELGKWGADSSRQLRRYLRAREYDGPVLFPSRLNDRMSTRSLRRLVKKIAVEAGIEPQRAGGGTGEPEDVTPHTLRHSVAYRIIQVDGGRLEDVQLRLRHANRQTTDQIYSHLVPR